MSRAKKSTSPVSDSAEASSSTSPVPPDQVDQLTAPGSPFAPTPVGRHSDDPPEDPDQVDDDQGDDGEVQGGDDEDDEDDYDPSKTPEQIADECDAVLIEGLGKNLRDALEEALTLGATPKQLIYSAKILTGGKINPRGSLVFMGIEAFFAKKAKEEQQRKPAEKIAPY